AMLKVAPSVIEACVGEAPGPRPVEPAARSGTGATTSTSGSRERAAPHRSDPLAPPTNRARARREPRRSTLPSTGSTSGSTTCSARAKAGRPPMHDGAARRLLDDIHEALNLIDVDLTHARANLRSWSAVGYPAGVGQTSRSAI